MTRTALVAGATGHVGSHLIPRLTDAGWAVRALVRDPAKVDGQPWADLVSDDDEAGRVRVTQGDADDRESLDAAMAGVDVAWFLIHSMGESSGSFSDEEQQTASTFGEAAKAAGVSRIVYLGGLHPTRGELSEHLQSRVDVGEALMASGVPTAALQAGVVIGEGSSSFDMLRHLSERLPGAVGPSWLKNEIQPIAQDDLLHYLVAAADLPSDVNRTFDVGGPDALSYADMMSRYAEALGQLPRPVATGPVTTPRAAARWISLVTPVPYDLARPLVESLVVDTVVKERDLDSLVGNPPGGHTPFDEAVREAAKNLDTGRWRRTILGTSAATIATAVVGSLVTKPGSRWYATLRKPRWQPPAAAFPIAWSALYFDIAFISALVLADLGEQGKREEQRAYATALGVNLVLNASWSAVFFGAHRTRLGVLVSALLTASSADLVRRSAATAPERAVLLSAYPAWTTFATALNASIARRNPRRR